MYFETDTLIIPFEHIRAVMIQKKEGLYVSFGNDSVRIKECDKDRFLKEYKKWLEIRSFSIPYPIYPVYPQNPPTYDPGRVIWSTNTLSEQCAGKADMIKTTL